VAALPIQPWNYKGQPSDARHIGPVAQDFARSFGVGDDARVIYNVDALTSTQALYKMLEQGTRLLLNCDARWMSCSEGLIRSPRGQSTATDMADLPSVFVM
jgi:hypothetical protein